MGATAGSVSASVKGSKTQLSTNNLSNLDAADTVNIEFTETILGNAAEDADLKQLKALKAKTKGIIKGKVNATIDKLSNATYGLTTDSKDDIELTVAETTAGSKLKTEFNALYNKTKARSQQSFQR